MFRVIELYDGCYVADITGGLTLDECKATIRRLQITRPRTGKAEYAIVDQETSRLVSYVL